MKTRSAILYIILVLILVAGIGYALRFRIIDVWNDWMAEPEPQPISFPDILNRSNANTNVGDDSNANTNTNSSAVQPLPAEFNLAVPFTTQAPYANWDELHEESCEEASAITVHYYYQNKTFTQGLAEQEIQDFVAYENSTLGFYKDTTAQETADLIQSYWGYRRVEVISNPTVEEIKRHIAAGRPVIVPAAGRQLENPYFTAPGPLYHMFVIRGYTADEFITNDVGTRRGENFHYTTENVMQAMHDWNGGDVDTGQKVIIVVYPNID